MIKDNNKLLFDSIQQFNEYIFNSLNIDLNLFTAVSKNGQNDVSVYYISPAIRNQGELSIVSDAKILSLPIDFVYNTIKVLPKDKYQMVDVTIILKANLEEGFNAKNVTSIRMKFDLSNTTRSDVYSSFMTKATTKIEVDNYNLFTLQKIDAYQIMIKMITY